MHGIAGLFVLVHVSRDGFLLFELGIDLNVAPTGQLYVRSATYKHRDVRQTEDGARHGVIEVPVRHGISGNGVFRHRFVFLKLKPTIFVIPIFRCTRPERSKPAQVRP